jgi:cell wall-associated NlpC family hydrolase
MTGRGRWLIVPSLATAAGLALLSVGAVLPAGAATSTGVATTSVNIRSGPSTNHTILGGLVRGQRITVTGKASRGWVKVRFNRGTGYMFGEYLNRTGKHLPAAPTKVSASGTKITTEPLNVRSGPSTKYRIVGSLSEGTGVKINGTFRSGFAQFRYGGVLRWVSLTYLARSTSATAPPAATPAPGNRGEVALAFARKQIGKPYQWGAEGPNAYDCSGLAQAAWRAAGVSIPRVTTSQFKIGRRVAKADLKLGDLVFFYGPNPSHVGLYAGQGLILAAPRPGKTVGYTKISSMPYAGAVRPG